MYADDTVLLYSVSSSKLIEETLNHESNILFDWFNNNISFWIWNQVKQNWLFMVLHEIWQLNPNTMSS